jgi:hypothetical protein
LEQQQKSRGWRVVNFKQLKAPPEWLAAAVYVLATLLLAYVLYMIGLGLFAFTELGHEIASGSGGTTAAAPVKGEGGGSLAIFFTVLLALVGGPLVIWRVITAHVQAQAARHQADTAREGHYTDLFTKAVEQLGATREVKKYVPAVMSHIKGERELVTETEPNLEVRLGAIYALDRIARDSERDHGPIMEVLCAYIRNPQNSGLPKPFPDGFNDMKPPRVDIQAALTVIGKRPPERIAFEADRGLFLDLSSANFQRVQLSGIFTRANLSGAHLEMATFVNVQLKDALLHSAHLEWAQLWETHFEGALLVGAHLQGALLGAHLKGASLTGANLEGAQFDRAHLEGARLFNTDLSKVGSLDPNSLASALGDATTKLPEGMQRPATWPDRELDKSERDAWISLGGRWRG